MNHIQPGLYIGKVVHKRLQPVAHALEYKVASVLLDVDQLGSGLPGLLRYNAAGLFSLHDKDYGDKDMPLPIAAFAWKQMHQNGAPKNVTRIMMLTYPRMLGYGFNPLTVYFGLDGRDCIRMVIHEVHNTFGGRHCYVAGPFAAGEDAFVATEKVFRVSPFNKIEGHYGLRVTVPGDKVAVGVSLTTDDGPILKAYFTGLRHPLNNRSLLRVLAAFPLMTFKVMAGIHWEALKLWRKGLKLESS
jgi:uncharacterized protein